MAVTERSRSPGKKVGAGQRGGCRDFEALRKRRMQAATMFARGRRQVDVVTALGVSAQTASRWYQAWATGGRQALAGAGRAGRRPKVTTGQLAEIEAALQRGPTAHGFATDLWTLARVATVIERLTGVRYSQTQTWVLLRQRLGWSRQRPAKAAVERDDAAIQQWITQDWPRIKKAPDAAGPGSSLPTKATSH